MKISICPACGSPKIKKTKGAFEIVTRKKKVSVPDIEYHQCQNCGERFTDIENEKRIDDYLTSKRSHAA